MGQNKMKKNIHTPSQLLLAFQIPRVHYTLNHDRKKKWLFFSLARENIFFLYVCFGHHMNGECRTQFCRFFLTAQLFDNIRPGDQLESPAKLDRIV